MDSAEIVSIFSSIFKCVEPARVFMIRLKWVSDLFETVFLMIFIRTFFAINQYSGLTILLPQFLPTFLHSKHVNPLSTRNPALCCNSRQLNSSAETHNQRATQWSINIYTFHRYVIIERNSLSHLAISLQTTALQNAFYDGLCIATNNSVYLVCAQKFP